MIELKDIQKAHHRISDQVVRTPLALSQTLSRIYGSEISLKLECLQTTGSFKLRGATNAMATLTEKEKACGVVCVSTGNHGRGLAFAAKQNNINAIVCMGSLVPQVKIDGIKALGAEVRIIGNSQEDAQIEADRLVEEHGMTMVSPFDDLNVIAGQGSIGLEILQQNPQTETVIVPMSGGGLLSGVAAAIKLSQPEIRVIGVSMENGCAMYKSIRAGKPVDVDEVPTLADSLGGGIGDDNAYTLPLIQKYVDETILVTEEEIAQAIRHALL